MSTHNLLEKLLEQSENLVSRDNIQRVYGSAAADTTPQTVGGIDGFIPTGSLDSYELVSDNAGDFNPYTLTLNEDVRIRTLIVSANGVVPVPIAGTYKCVIDLRRLSSVAAGVTIRKAGASGDVLIMATGENFASQCMLFVPKSRELELDSLQIMSGATDSMRVSLEITRAFSLTATEQLVNVTPEQGFAKVDLRSIANLSAGDRLRVTAVTPTNPSEITVDLLSRLV